MNTEQILDSLQAGNYIAFGFNYNGGNDHTSIEVAEITSVSGDEFLVHWLYGYKSMGEYIKREDVIAVGNNETGTLKIQGWSGKFIQLKNHPLL